MDMSFVIISCDSFNNYMHIGSCLITVNDFCSFSPCYGVVGVEYD